MWNLTESFLGPKQWYPAPDRIVVARPWFLPTVILSFVVATMLPRKESRLAALGLLPVVCQIRSVSSGKTTEDFALGSLIWGFVIKYIDFGMLNNGNVWKSNAREAPIDSEQKSRGIVLRTWHNFTESAELWLFNYRGIGWNWGPVGGILAIPPQSRRYFLYRTALRILGTFILLDLGRYTMGSFTFVQSENRPPFFDQDLLVQVSLTWLHQLEAYCFFNTPYQIAAFCTVATGFSAPNDWPPLFGNLSDAWLVSRAWGRTWHQLLRRPLGIATPFVQRWLGATSRKSKRTTSLFSSFTMSGFAHWSGALNLPYTPNSHGMFTYFIMQAPIIRLEDYVFDWGKAKGIRGNLRTKMVGYVWVIVWISYSMRYAAAYQFETGALHKHTPLKYSLIDFVVSGIQDRYM